VPPATHGCARGHRAAGQRFGRPARAAPRSPKARSGCRPTSADQWPPPASRPPPWAASTRSPRGPADAGRRERRSCRGRRTGRRRASRPALAACTCAGTARPAHARPIPARGSGLRRPLSLRHADLAPPSAHPEVELRTRTPSMREPALPCVECVRASVSNAAAAAAAASSACAREMCRALSELSRRPTRRGASLARWTCASAAAWVYHGLVLRRRRKSSRQTRRALAGARRCAKVGNPLLC
jgi:hypothetical protein